MRNSMNKRGGVLTLIGAVVVVIVVVVVFFRFF